MMSYAVDVLLWLVVAVLAIIAQRRGRAVLVEGGRVGVKDFWHLVPRIGMGVIGAGFIAEVLPKTLIGPWLGPESGITGILFAMIAGALTPGGPVVGFALGAAALKGGAGAPQIIAFTTAWALFALHRIVLFEVPMMPARVVWLRALVCVPMPFIAAFAAMLAGKP